LTEEADHVSGTRPPARSNEQEEPAAIRHPKAGRTVHVAPVDALKPADSPRLVGEDAEHIRVLAESGRALPPILVHRATMRVIDGMHRLSAARLRGQDAIDVVFFDGSAEDAFVLAVRTNITHGLPLSYADREAAVARIVNSHPDWSDRAIAATTGLATHTVAAVRARIVGLPQPTARIGRDGRVRPLDSTDGRLAASRLITAFPDASLREIARAAGISAATVRNVRERLQRGDDPVPARRARNGRQVRPDSGGGTGEATRDDAERLSTQERDAVLQRLERDPSLRFAESGHKLLRWLGRRVIAEEEWRDIAASVPPHAAYILTGLARRCATEWLEFAKKLEQQLGTQS
jgi:ParB-like chromosome segregation protein Spo0J